MGGCDVQVEMDDVPIRSAGIDREVKGIAVGTRPSPGDVRIAAAGILGPDDVDITTADGRADAGGGGNAPVVEIDVQLNGLATIDDAVPVATAVTVRIIVDPVAVIHQRPG